MNLRENVLTLFASNLLSFSEKSARHSLLITIFPFRKALVILGVQPTPKISSLFADSLKNAFPEKKNAGYLGTCCLIVGTG